MQNGLKKCGKNIVAHDVKLLRGARVAGTFFRSVIRRKGHTADGGSKALNEMKNKMNN